MRYFLIAIMFSLTVLHAKEGIDLEKLFQNSFGKDISVGQKTIALNPADITKLQTLAKAKMESKKVRAYFVKRSGRTIGYGVVLVQTVRTKKAVILYMIDKDIRIKSIEILAFKEPSEYKPNSAWYKVFEGKGMHDDLVAGKGVPLISGATMSARSISNASRLALAIISIYKD